MNLRIRNWDKWQSYRKDRGQPPWIKIHRQVMRNPDWVALTDAQRGQLVAIWLLAADRDGVIPASPSVLRKLCYLDSEPDLKLFIEKGFIEPPQDGVTVTPERRQHDAPETETETETETDSKRARAREAEIEFSVWYEGYPHKVGRSAALKAFAGARRKASLDELIEGVRRYIREKPPDRQWCNPATWLNQERWKDQPGQVKTGTSVHDAIRELRRHANPFDEPAPELRIGSSGNPVRLLSPG